MTMSRPDERSSLTRSRKSRVGKPAGEQTDALQMDNQLPPRHVKHPSNKFRMARLFYNLLIFMFLMLASGLFLFGKQLAGK